MPFTPYHFGVGFAIKAAFPNRFYLLFFILLQVCIDVEVLYNLAYQHKPIHGFLHTFIGATFLAGLTSSLVLPAMVRWRRASAKQDTAAGRFPRSTYAAVIGTALVATWSHVALDSTMHHDLEPFWPIFVANPLIGLVSTGTIHLACLVLGFFGIIFLLFQLAMNERR